MRVTCFFLFLMLLGLAGAAADEPANPVPTLRMIHLRDGLRSVSPGGDLGRLRETTIFRTARAAGLDLRRLDDEILAQHYEHRRLFYLFYKTVDRAIGDRPYLIQRIKKTTREWKTAESEPEVTVHYQVEVFKTLAGSLKRPDQHYGSYALRGWYRREVLKEYEIGFGEVPGVCVGTVWPFATKSLYELLQPYGPATGHFDDVVFSAVRRWTLTVSLDREGGYAVTSPELGFDAPGTMPSQPETFRDPATKRVVLTAGVGVDGLEVGLAFDTDIRGALGVPLGVDRFASGSANYITARELIVNVDPEKTVNTIFTRSGFAGQTDLGIRLGSTRVDVMGAYGVPLRQQTDGPFWRYPGIVFFFDGWHEVTRIVIRRLPE